MVSATIRAPGLKVTVPLAAEALPGDLVPMEGPAGEPTLDLVLEGGPLTARAKLNGKNYREPERGGWLWVASFFLIAARIRRVRPTRSMFA
jgi:hypothetical protein